MDSKNKHNYFQALNCFQDVRYLNQALTNTFCYHLTKKTVDEQNFCTNYTSFCFVHLFFQQVILWYLLFNFIRRDKINTVAIYKVGELCVKKDIPLETEDGNRELDSEKREIALQANERKEDNQLYASDDFTEKVEKYYNKKLRSHNQTLMQNILYTIFQPVLIAIFCGFILGLITPVKTFFFNPKTEITVILKLI